MMEYIITDLEIKEIKELINSHNIIKIKTILNNLKPFEDNLRKELEKEIRNLGKSNMISVDRLKQILKETENDFKR